MKRLPLVLLIIGLIFSLGGPVVGMICTVFGILDAFQTLGPNGISDPRALSSHIGFSLMSTMSGLIVSIGVGLPLIVIALVIHFVTRKPRAPANSSPRLS